MLKLIIILAAVAVCHVQASERIYYLYTRGNSRPQNMTVDDSSLPSTYVQENKAIILIHGHGGRVTSQSNQLIIEQLFKVGKQYNIIVVDWEKEASNGYNAAMQGVRPAANHLAGFIRWLAAQTTIGTDNNNNNKNKNNDNDNNGNNENDNNNNNDNDNNGNNENDNNNNNDNDNDNGDKNPIVSVQDLHLVGFGLGAHIAGIASRQLILSLGQVGRITGLDPSGSGWGSRSERLKADDAKYVEVIHTDGTGLLANGIGTAIGDIDFFVNGGSNQPGCLSHSCSHDRAWELFAASMGGHLYGNRCSTKTQVNLNLCKGDPLNMGNTDLHKRAPYDSIYRANTKRNFPF